MSGTTIKISESQFATQVEHLLDLYQWRWMHIKPSIMQSGRWASSMTGHKGFPDYCAVRGGQVLVIELKASGGRTSPDQDQWLAELGGHGRLWKPADLDEIKRELSRPVRGERSKS